MTSHVLGVLLAGVLAAGCTQTVDSNDDSPLTRSSESLLQARALKEFHKTGNFDYVLLATPLSTADIENSCIPKEVEVLEKGRLVTRASLTLTSPGVTFSLRTPSGGAIDVMTFPKNDEIVFALIHTAPFGNVIGRAMFECAR